MKKLVYLSIIMFLGVGCSHQGTSSNHSSDTVYIAPDSVWDYSYIDSIDYDLKCKAYEIYGDSDATGLPDSVMRRKDSIERLRE
jgi:hypothetical protein